MTLEMDPEIRARWVAALRSGEYPQSNSALHNDDGFCCLGVLCELAAKDGVLTPVRTDTNRWSYDGETSVLPEAVQNWAGLGAANPIVDLGDRAPALAWLNDGYTDDDAGGGGDDVVYEPLTFDEIADVIEGATP